MNGWMNWIHLLFTPQQKKERVRVREKMYFLCRHAGMWDVCMLLYLLSPLH